MLINVESPAWWYMEVPRTGTTTTTSVLRHLYKYAYAPYAKHWPLAPPPYLTQKAKSLINVRNPYSRAVSCWQFFTVPGSVSFLDWTYERIAKGFVDINIEARPQFFWYKIAKWDYVIRQECFKSDLSSFLQGMGLPNSNFNFPVLNATGSDWVNRLNLKTSREKPWHAYYCSKSEENVKELYSKDFTALSNYYPESLSDCIDKLNVSWL